MFRLTHVLGVVQPPLKLLTSVHNVRLLDDFHHVLIQVINCEICDMLGFMFEQNYLHVIDCHLPIAIATSLYKHYC